MAAEAKSAGNEEQAAILADGEVTVEEYAAAFSALRACVAGDDIAVTDPVTSPVSNDRYEFRYDFPGLEPAAAVEVIERCEARYWTSVTMVYSFTRSPSMSPDLRAATGDCLAGRGIDAPSEATSVASIVEAVGSKHDKSVFACIDEVVRALYPEMPAVSISY